MVILYVCITSTVTVSQVYDSMLAICPRRGPAGAYAGVAAYGSVVLPVGTHTYGSSDEFTGNEAA